MNDLDTHAFQIYKNYYQLQSIDILKNMRDEIVLQIYTDEALKSKIDGMLYRNNVHKDTQIANDVLQDTIYRLLKYDTEKLIEAYCNDYRRVFALAITITVRHSFSKLNKDIHQNGSLLKNLLYLSNLNRSYYLSTSDDVILIKDEKVFDKKYEITPTIEDDFWKNIKEHLTKEQNDFLDFLFEKVLNKKYTQAYSRDLRKNHYTFNEYRLRRLELQSRIKEIIKNNK